MKFSIIAASILAVATTSMLVSAESMMEKVNLGGDLRFRFENAKTKDGSDAVDRYRIRARVKLDSQVSEKTKVTMQFASGTNDGTSITSTNQDLGADPADFANKPFEIDMAYFDHTISEGLVVTAGKMKNPYIRPGKSDLMWDSDVTPEGIALVYKQGIINANLSEMQVERGKSSTNYELVAAQLGVDLELGAGQFKFGVGNFTYTDTKDVVLFGSAKGNSTVGTAPNEYYANNYKISQVFLEYGMEMSGLPVVFFADYIQNAEAEENNTGYLAGFKVGKAKKQGTWSAQVVYRMLEKDATIGRFTDGDFGGGGTDVQGSKVGLSYAMSDKGTVGLTHYMNEKTISDEANKLDYSKTHVDFMFSF